MDVNVTTHPNLANPKSRAACRRYVLPALSSVSLSLSFVVFSCRFSCPLTSLCSPSFPLFLSSNYGDYRSCPSVHSRTGLPGLLLLRPRISLSSSVRPSSSSVSSPHYSRTDAFSLSRPVAHAHARTPPRRSTLARHWNSPRWRLRARYSSGSWHVACGVWGNSVLGTRYQVRRTPHASTSRSTPSSALTHSRLSPPDPRSFVA